MTNNPKMIEPKAWYKKRTIKDNDGNPLEVWWATTDEEVNSKDIERCKPLIDVEEVVKQPNTVYKHGNELYKIQALKLCDKCQNETNLLSIADGLDLCPDCLHLLHQLPDDQQEQKMVELQAENLGCDPEYLL